MKRLLSLALIPLMFVLGACTQVSTGNVGVTSTMNQISTEEVLPGVHWTVFKTVHEVNGKEITLPFNDLKPKSADGLTMEDMDVDVIYKINPAKAADIMVRFSGDAVQADGEDGLRVGNNYVSRQAREAIYGAAATLKGADMNGRRDDVKESIRKSLQSELDKDVGKDWFYITGINIRSLVVDKALEGSMKASAQQKYELEKKQQEVELAKKEAERLAELARGQANANRIISDSLTPQLVKLREIEKWNGVMPTTQLGSGASPTFQVNKQ